MQELEQRLQQRFPDWFRGRRGHLARPLLRGVGRWSRLDRVDAFLRQHAGVRGFDFVAAGLDFLDSRYQVDPAELARIPATGRLLIVANHPSGALDALALLDAVGRVRIGTPMSLAEGDAGAQLKAVRRALYALGRGAPGGNSVAAGPEPLAAPIAPAQVARAIAAACVLGQTGDGKQILLARCAADCPLLLELGRLRELTFRQVGEGTGRSRDLDAFDLRYEHIVIWDGAAQRVAGAYRIMRGAQALARDGLAGLYSAALFRYADDAIPRIAEGLELGRSFVVPDYWGSRSLDYLWQGIGAYLQCRQGIRYLFGAVSISAALPREAREQLVAYYQRYYGAAAGLAESNRPFQYFAAPPSFGELDASAAFDVLKANLAALGTGVPTLYRQYTDLCEPGGARFLAFGVDPDFSDSIDGLIEVDLQAIRPNKRKRYLRPAEASA